MKALKRFNIAALLVLAVSSCSKLKETPYSTIYTTNFYSTAADAEAALAAVYSFISSIYNITGTTLSDWSADQTYPRAVVGRDVLTLMTYDPNFTAQRSLGRVNESPSQFWFNCYRGIEKANWVIERVPGINMDAARRTQIVAEAYFLRAFFHWQLTKNFGDVVIKTKTSQTEADALNPKSIKAEVYKQIYLDYEAAIAGLPSATGTTISKGRPSKEAAQGLYAKAALYNEDWANALKLAQAVIASGKYALMPTEKDVFDLTKEDAARLENIWAYEGESSTPSNYTQIGYLFAPTGAVQYSKAGSGSIYAYQSFFDSFNPIDGRRQLLDTNYVTAAGVVIKQASITPITKKGVLVKKYQDPNSVGANHANNIPLIRMADVYLIAAEAEARLNGSTTLAYSYVNIIRKRAGIPDLAPGLGKDAFIDAVIQERSWEFFAEGDRWYDLTRTGKFMDVIPKATNEVYPVRTVQLKNKYFPIPQEEINANPKLTQNDAWK